MLLATFGITLFRGLTEAIVVGFALGSVLFIHRMSQTTALETHVPLAAEDVPDDEARDADDETSGQDPTVVVYRISGAFFFGAAASIGAVLERIGDAQRNLIIDFSAVPFVDSTGAKTIEVWRIRPPSAASASCSRGCRRGSGGNWPRKAHADRWSRRRPRSIRPWPKFGAKGQHRRRWLSLSIRPRLRPKCRHPRQAEMTQHTAGLSAKQKHSLLVEFVWLSWPEPAASCVGPWVRAAFVQMSWAGAL